MYSPIARRLDRQTDGWTAADSATFSFGSTEPDSTFLCSLDGAKPSVCSSPNAYKSLAAGDHKFAVRAVDRSGNVDKTPANRAWIQAVIRRPDGRIRMGTGASVGDDIYNTSALGQKRAGSAAPGQVVSFHLSIQNDGNDVDKFMVKATGAAVVGYRVMYFDGATDVTPAVEAGSYVAPMLAPGATHGLWVRVNVETSAAVGSRVSRLVTITSVGDSTRVDAVKFVGKRA